MEALRDAGGVARTGWLARRGVTRHAVRSALASGEVERIRPGWLALAGADAELRAAAEIGVVLSCVTIARRRGLWTPTAREAHVAAQPHARLMRETTAHVHWSVPVVPRDPEALEDSLVNALVILSGCRPYEESLAVWESALRLDAIDLDVVRRLELPPGARRMVADVLPFADAGTETVVFTRLKWLRLPLRRQVWIAGHPVDLLIGDRLVIQIDGGHHVDAQRLIDNEHDARLRLLGYHVIRVGYHQIFGDWPVVQELILTAIAQRLHLADR
ncbi:hypothetical protein GCM10022202_24690 [Microbacterium marinilacus]|uniref:DUF559 domain-containing protein n=1 Tax=Microbacterium marinilacus TaxID=415209 RepID=A0ABP7BJ09_9MICO